MYADALKVLGFYPTLFFYLFRYYLPLLLETRLQAIKMALGANILLHIVNLNDVK